MTHRLRLLSLYLYFGMYFVSCGLTMFASRYMGVIGLDNSQIGIITAIPAFVSIFAQPLWGMISDRSAHKNTSIIIGFLLAALCAFAAHVSGSRYLPLLAALTLLNTMTLPATPVGTSIALEYTAQTGSSYGPVRMSGTIGYQLSILVAGFLHSEQLTGYYAIYGVTLLCCAFCAMLLPPTKGHQHGGQKVPLIDMLKNRRLMSLLAVVFIAQVVAQFFNAFFTKYLGDIGIGNSVTGIITTLTVVMEIPFLIFFGDRIFKKLTIIQWMWLGLIINGLRFVALSYVRSPLVILLTQLPSVALFACFEFFPVLYLKEIVGKEVLSTAQSVFQMTSFGLARIVGASAGGMLAQALGIAPVFRMGGVMLLVCAAVMIPSVRLPHRKEPDR